MLPVSAILAFLFFGSGRQTSGNVLTLIAALMIYSPVIAVATTLPVLSCYQVASKQLLFADMSAECWSPTHTTYTYALVLPSLLLNLLIPLTVIIVCIRLGKEMPIWKCGYMLRDWEVFLVCARVIYVGVVIGTQATSQLLQLTYGLVVLVCTCMGNVVLQPWVYQHEIYFLLPEFSLVIVTLSHGLVGYYIYYAPEDGWQDYFISAMFLALNAGFACLIIRFRVRNTLKKQSVSIQQSVNIQQSVHIQQSVSIQQPNSVQQLGNFQHPGSIELLVPNNSLNLIS